jgi:isocitrate lyase
VADIPLVVDCDKGLLPEFKLKRLWERRKSMDEDAFIKLCLERNDLVAGDDKYAVSETAKAMEKAGAAAIHIEDQDWCWKRCGHLDAKRLVSSEDMCEKIRKACRAR